ncbi:hypothetical protein Hanom_Chr02g00112051 [Helianthus anomalus]
MGDDVLPIIPLSCLRAGRGWVSAHLGEPRDWRRPSSQPWPQHPVSRWLTRRYLPLKKEYFISGYKCHSQEHVVRGGHA